MRKRHRKSFGTDSTEQCAQDTLLQGVTRYKLIPTFISEACVHSNATSKAIFNEVTCAILCKITSLTAFVSSSPFISFLTFSVFLFLDVRIPLDFASFNKNTEKHLLREDGCMAVTLRAKFSRFSWVNILSWVWGSAYAGAPLSADFYSWQVLK